MNAPKSLWVSHSTRTAYEEKHDGFQSTQYIRADIVEEMREALLGLIADFVINDYTDDDIEKAHAALKRLEED